MNELRLKSVFIGFILALFILPMAYAVTGGTHHNSTDLIGDWHTDTGSGTNASDDSGNAIHGTLVNTPAWVAGYNSTSGLDYEDASSESVTLGLNPYSNADVATGTLMLWTKLENPSGSQDEVVFTLEGVLSIQYDNSANKFECYIYDGSSVSDQVGADISGWQHIAITWNSSGFTCYQNATGFGFNSQGSPIVDSYERNGRIGGFHSAAAGFFYDGLIDEVRIFDTILTSSEIQLQMDLNATGLGAPAPPVDSPPTVTLNTPADTSFSDTQTILFNATPIDDNGFTNLTLYTNESGTFQIEQVNTSAVVNSTVNTISHNVGTEAIILWNMQVCDDNATPQCAFAAANFTVTVDTTAPSVSLASPTNITYPFDQLWVLLDYTITEANLDQSSYSLDGAANVSLNNLTGNLNITGLIAGSHDIEVFANDSAGNSDSTQIFFTIIENDAPDIFINSPTNTTYWNSSVFINVTIVHMDAHGQFCEIYNDSNLLTNISNITAYNNTWNGLTIGTHNLTVFCNDGFDTNTSTTLFTVDAWNFWVQNSDDNSFYQNFTLAFDNGTATSNQVVTTFNLSIIPTELPQGDNNITVSGTGFETTSFAGFSINASQDVNHTFSVDPSAILINFFNERTLARITNPLTVTFTNSSTTFVDGVINQFVSSTGGDDPALMCDRNTTSFTHTDIAADELNTTCYVSVDNTTATIFVVYKRTQDVASGLAIAIHTEFFNTDTSNWDSINITSVPSTDTSKNTISFTLNNTNRFYDGTMRIRTVHAGGNNDDMDVFEVYASHLLTIQHGYLEVPNANPVTIRAEDIDLLNEFPERFYFVQIDSNTRTTLNIYLIEEAFAQQVTWTVVSALTGVGLQDATLTLRKSIGGADVTVAQKITDSGGAATIWLDCSATYTYTVAKLGFGTFSGTLSGCNNPTVGMGERITLPFTFVYEDIEYTIHPPNTGLMKGDTLDINFTINSLNGSLTNFGMQVFAPNGTSIFSQTISGSPSGGSTLYSVNTTAITGQVTVTAFFLKSGFDQQNISQTYNIFDNTAQNYSIVVLFERVNDNTYEIEESSIGVIVIFILIMVMAAAAEVVIVGGSIVGLIALGLLTGLDFFTWGQFFAVALTWIGFMYLRWRT